MDIMKTKTVLHCLLGSLLLLVACTDEGSLSFSHAGSTVTLPAEAGAYVEIPFTCDAGWQATTDAEWLKVSPQSGAGGSHELTLTVSSPNNSGGLRSATLKVTSGSSGQTFTVRQDEYIRLEQEVYEIPVEGGNLDIRFATTLAADEFAVYSVTGVDWVHGRASSRVAETGYLVPLTADPNGGGQERVAYYYFVKESDRFTTDRNARILATATVVQKGSQSGQESADYSQDRKVKTLQTHTEGEGIPLVLMGDGFMDVDIAGGYYDEVMARAMDNLFTEEPVRSLRGYFDVYSVTAVSRRNSFTSGDGTAFGCTFEGGNSTGIYGDTDKVLDYAGEVEGIDPQEALSVVILNTNTYGGTTYIDGTKIMAGTVTASTLQGGSVELLNSSGGTAGMMYLRSASSASYAVGIDSYGAMSLEASGTLHLSGDGVIIDLGDNYIGCGKTLRPAGDDAYDVGTSSWRWSTIYAATPTISTSDRSEKTDINYDISAYDAIFDALKPASFRYVNGTSGRTHTGFISQDIEDALESCGLTSMQFATFIKSPQDDGGYRYGLRYEELIALCVKQIQALKRRVAGLEAP